MRTGLYYKKDIDAKDRQQSCEGSGAQIIWGAAEGMGGFSLEKRTFLPSTML